MPYSILINAQIIKTNRPALKNNTELFIKSLTYQDKKSYISKIKLHKRENINQTEGDNKARHIMRGNSVSELCLHETIEFNKCKKIFVNFGGPWFGAMWS